MRFEAKCFANGVSFVNSVPLVCFPRLLFAIGIRMHLISQIIREDLILIN